MELGQENGVTEETQVESPSTEQAEVSQVEGTNQSADSENTGKSDYVPYTRFKEVNDKYRGTEKEYNEYKDSMSYWEQLNKVANENPAFNEAFNELIEKYNKGELTKKEEKQLENAVNQQSEQQEFRDPRVDQMMQERERENFAKYEHDFHKVAAQDFESKEDRALVGKILTDIINNKNPNANIMSSYDPTLIDKYYAEAKGIVDNMFKRYQARYMETKSSDNIPSSKPGAAPTTTVDWSNASQKQVASRLAEALRNSKD